MFAAKDYVGFGRTAHKRHEKRTNDALQNIEQGRKSRGLKTNGMMCERCQAAFGCFYAGEEAPPGSGLCDDKIEQEMGDQHYDIDISFGSQMYY